MATSSVVQQPPVPGQPVLQPQLLPAAAPWGVPACALGSLPSAQQYLPLNSPQEQLPLHPPPVMPPLQSAPQRHLHPAPLLAQAPAVAQAGCPAAAQVLLRRKPHDSLLVVRQQQPQRQHSARELP